MERLPDAEEIVVAPDEQGKPVPVICMRDGKRLTSDIWRAASAGLTGLGHPIEVKPEQLQRTATIKARRYLITEMIKNPAISAAGQVPSPEVVLREGA
jgi:hypothetical protein